MVVEPTTSANRTVTRRRVSCARLLAQSAERGIPQFRQKLAPSRLGSPHVGQASMDRVYDSASRANSTRTGVRKGYLTLDARKSDFLVAAAVTSAHTQAALPKRAR